MNRLLHQAAGAIALLALAGCKSTAPASAPRTGTVSAVTSVIMSPAARAEAAKLAQSHPPFKLFLQQIDVPTVLVVAESATDDQLRALLWFLRTQVRSGNFKAIGMHPTVYTWGRPGFGSGSINIYRGPRCAAEMYTPAGRPDPCGPSIHKSAGYHWGDAGDPRADEGDLIAPSGATLPVFSAADGWQTEDEARADPTGTLHQATVARIQYASAQTARQVKQRTDIRFFTGAPPDVPDTQLNAISYQFATEEASTRFLRDFLILEQDHLCAAAFQTVALGVRGSPGKPYPIPCRPTR